MVKFCGNLVTPVPERFTWLPRSPMSSSPLGLRQGPWRTRSAGSCCRRRCQGWRSWVCFAVGPGRLSPYRTGKRVAVGRHRWVDALVVWRKNWTWSDQNWPYVFFFWFNQREFLPDQNWEFWYEKWCLVDEFGCQNPSIFLGGFGGSKHIDEWKFPWNSLWPNQDIPGYTRIIMDDISVLLEWQRVLKCFEDAGILARLWGWGISPKWGTIRPRKSPEILLERTGNETWQWENSGKLGLWMGKSSNYVYKREICHCQRVIKSKLVRLIDNVGFP